MSKIKITDEEGKVYYVEEEKTTSEKLHDVGSAMQSCGCLLTIFVTIPILLLLASMLF